ncbi:MAG TPA: UDP-N-acetylmuramoyl-tripeptide--D-alanyl-D-alanine ligase [Woeseiaceae bacterium]|nr:UDP-N-acetylmuramoyl-tripeptide--D-alanyl-D-alanine ligase [Woeseiaceae bacterium]
MIEGTLARACAEVDGRLQGADAAFHGISTDSRRVQPRELFFALRGPSFDGADFVPQAAAAGAAGAVVARPVTADLPVIEVDDTRRALGALAAAWRRRMPARVIGLTGTNGKTTLKEMIASCLGTSAPTLATRGNLNNDVGVPLMLAELEDTHRYAVIEMGANHPGEIAWLRSIVAPDIAVITNAGPGHLEGFGTVAGVARAKGELLEGEPRPQCAVLNADDPHLGLWRTLAADVPVRTFGFGDDADVRALDVVTGPGGTDFVLAADGWRRPVSLPLAGRHNARLAAAAAAAVLAAGLGPDAIVEGLARVAPVSGRLAARRGIAGCTLYDDTYNANPASVAAAAELLGSAPGERWFVLGDMGELGPEGARLHRRTGEAIAAAGVDRLFATGPLSKHAVEAFGDDAAWFESVEALSAALVDEIATSRRARETTVLVKGSRAMRMERVVQALEENAAGRGN